MRNPERVSLRPLLGGLILLLALTVIGATRFNSAEQREILDRTGSQLSAYTSTAAAMVTVWTGVQRDAVAEMARYDMLRLLAAEIAETDLPVALLRELGETPWTEQEHGRHSGLDARDRQALRDISPHATLIYRKFVEFISRHDFAGAALLDRTLEPVMLVGQGWQADTRTLLKQRRSKGALSGAGMLPVRLQGERLLVDFYCPVTAPGYVSADDSPQGILLVTCDIGKLLGGVGQSSELGYMSLLLETGGDLVQAIGMGERPSLNLVTLPAGFGQDMTPRDMVLPAISGTMDCLVVGPARAGHVLVCGRGLPGGQRPPGTGRHGLARLDHGRPAVPLPGGDPGLVLLVARHPPGAGRGAGAERPLRDHVPAALPAGYGPAGHAFGAGPGGW